ncbi:unnamed protein product [Prunus brigantina]
MNQSGGANSRRRKAWTHRRRNFGPPSSPFLHWNFDDDKTTGVVQASARKLAAGLWQLRFNEISRDQDLKFNSGPSDPPPPQLQLEPSSQYPECASERETKWSPGGSKEFDDIYRFYNHLKLLKDRPVTTGSVVSTMNAELTEARLCILALEAKRQSLKKKVKHFLRKLEEERIYWKSRAQQKNRSLDELKEELGRERKSRQQMENLNTNLINQLAGAKFSAEHFMKKYEEEKKSRKLMQEISNELAEQIGEDKAEVEALKRESKKIIAEVEEERKMLQIAEVWREERVQMKLIDAKLALEDKYCQLNKLITDVETFLRSRFGTLDMTELRKAELILQAVKSLNIHGIEEFSNVPPKSNDIFSVFEELWRCEGSEREIEPCICHTPSSHEDNGFNQTHLLKQLNCHNDYNSCLQKDARGSCDSLEGGNPAIDRVGQGKTVSRSFSDGNDNAVQCSPDREISEVCAASEKQSKRKTSSASKLWGSCPSNDEFYKIGFDEGEERLSNGITSRWGENSNKGLFEHDTTHRCSAGQRIPTDTVNPHITRGMKGSIEWPRAIQKNGSKVKLLDAKIESQKSQLRHVLKQKAR